MWGAQTKPSRYKPKETWGAQDKKSKRKGTDDEDDRHAKDGVFTGTVRYGLLGRKRR